MIRFSKELADLRATAILNFLQDKDGSYPKIDFFDSVMPINPEDPSTPVLSVSIKSGMVVENGKVKMNTSEESQLMDNYVILWARVVSASGKVAWIGKVGIDKDEDDFVFQTNSFYKGAFIRLMGGTLI